VKSVVEMLNTRSLKLLELIPGEIAVFWWKEPWAARIIDFLFAIIVERSKEKSRSGMMVSSNIDLIDLQDRYDH
jgi:hypothetical protein